jgi:polysaccharide export outer membrane protein
MAPRKFAVLTIFAILTGGAAAAQTPAESANIICAAVDPQTYVLGPADVLFIKVYDGEKFTGPQVVRPDGKISLYLLNEVQAAGLTPLRLQDQLKVALTEYMQKPEVLVTVSEVNSRKYQIQGEVNKQGTFPLAAPTRVFEALANAGGFKDFANRKDIRILRADGRILHFSWTDYTNGKKRELNIYLENGDTIVVN